MSSKSESEEKEANKTSKKAAKVMKGRMQEDNSQSGFTYSHGQEEEEKNLSQLAILDKDTIVNFAVIKHIWSFVCTKVPLPDILMTLYHAKDMLV